MMNCLLTGASGFVGSQVLDYLLENTDWTFICPCSWKHKGTPERILELENYKNNIDRVRVLTHDLTAPFTDHTIEGFGKIDYILNIASESHVDRSIDEPRSFIENNTLITLNMFELSRVIKPKVFLQFSTDEVYGVAPEGVNHPEWAAIVPSNPYSASKACQEAIAISYWRTYSVPLIITNTMNLFGPRQDREKYTSQLIHKISQGDIVTIHGLSKDNCGSRYYLHIKNLADAVLFILNNVEPVMYQDGDDTIRPERFNIVGDREITNWELACIVSEEMNKVLRYKFVDFHSARPGHDRRYALSGKKLYEKGWRHPMTFKDSIADLVGWSRNNNDW